MSVARDDSLPISDPKIAAGAVVLGGKLVDITRDAASGRVSLAFSGLGPDFLVRAFNGDLVVNLRDYVDALERVHALIAQVRRR